MVGLVVVGREARAPFRASENQQSRPVSSSATPLHYTLHKLEIVLAISLLRVGQGKLKL